MRRSPADVDLRAGDPDQDLPLSIDQANLSREGGRRLGRLPAVASQRVNVTVA
jgi:hypothetical protein